MLRRTKSRTDKLYFMRLLLAILSKMMQHLESQANSEKFQLKKPEHK